MLGVRALLVVEHSQGPLDSPTIKPSMKADLQALADADRRKLATYVEIVLEEHVAAKKAAAKKK
jgi:hypothetical protein